jgi:dienelactone hydrolase
MLRRIERERPGGWFFHPTSRPVQQPLHVSLPLPLPVAGFVPVPRVEMVFLEDGTYLPAVVRVPDGPGPHPLIICVHGWSGGLGVGYLVDELLNHGWLAEELVDAGFAVAIAEGRREIEEGYDKDLPCPLDHDDMVTVALHLASLPDVDATRMGWIGTSHGGELGAKVASEPENPVRAFALCEPAAIEYLGLRHRAGSADVDGPISTDDSSGARSEVELDFDRMIGDDEVDVPGTMRRIDAIAAGVSFLVYGREGDHLQGVFRKTHELLDRAGRDVTWRTSQHPEHVAQWGPRRDGAGYTPDAVQLEVRDELLQFFRAKLA